MTAKRTVWHYAILMVVGSLFAADIATTYYGVCIKQAGYEVNAVAVWGGYLLSFPLFAVLFDGGILLFMWTYLHRFKRTHMWALFGLVVVMSGMAVYNNFGLFVAPLPAVEQIHQAAMSVVNVPHQSAPSFDLERFCTGPFMNLPMGSVAE